MNKTQTHTLIFQVVPKLHYTYQCIGITSLFVQEHFLAESNMISRSHPAALASIAVHLTLTSGKSKVLNIIKHGQHMLFLSSSGAKQDEIFFLFFFSDSPFQSLRPYIVHLPKRLRINHCFQFSWVLRSSLKESKTIVIQNFWG